MRYKVTSHRKYFRHSSGTKYYVTQTVAIWEILKDGSPLYKTGYFVTNYGKTVLGLPAVDYTCKRGGTSAYKACVSIGALGTAESAETRKRFNRGYVEVQEFPRDVVGEDLEPMLHEIGLISGHIAEMMMTERGEVVSPKLSDEMDAMVAKKKADIDAAKRAFAFGDVKTAGTTVPPKPEPDRGVEWGSW